MHSVDERQGPWIQCASGNRFFFQDPISEDVDINDIAHALSRFCRFGGHCRVPYYVSQHSVLVADEVLRATGSKEQAFIGLLHDAQEAYVGDLVRPLKSLVPEFSVVEERVWRVIAQKFGFDPALPPAVHEADMRMCRTEAQCIMPSTDLYDADVQPYDMVIEPWSSNEAEYRFLTHFHSLYGKL